MNKVLIITYYWPPSGGAGVQRWLKFSKYFPQFGWEPIILTVDPSYAAYPVTDESLSDGIPPSLKVHRTPALDYFSLYKKDKTKIPTAGFANSVDNTLKGKFQRFMRGNFFIPDPRRGWNKFAFKRACEIIETERIKYVITTSPPHSTQLIGLELKNKIPGIKWIADLRDPWTDIYYYRLFYPTFISKMIDQRYEKQVLMFSDRIITVGKSLKELFSSKIPEVRSKTEIITNGYDEDDFDFLTPSTPDIFTISYIGTLSDIYPVDGFLEALNNLNNPMGSIRLRFIGTVSPDQKDHILSYTQCSHVDFIPPVSHQEAVKYMVEATALLLIIPDHESNKGIITGKLFEYIAAGKPVICLGPAQGDAAEILSQTGHGMTFSYTDSTGISNYLASLVSGASFVEKISPKVFSRVELTSRVISLLEKL